MHAYHVCVFNCVDSDRKPLIGRPRKTISALPSFALQSTKSTDWSVSVQLLTSRTWQAANSSHKTGCVRGKSITQAKTNARAAGDLTLRSPKL